MIIKHDKLDELLEQWRGKIGDDWQAYRNHAYRVLNLACEYSPGVTEQEIDLIAIAAAYHDVGIWLDKTFDYLEPSIIRAQTYLKVCGDFEVAQLEGFQELIGEMILNHHRIRAVKGPEYHLVEAFRKADWCDVSFGRLRQGLPKAKVKAILREFPESGFHLLLAKLTLDNVSKHPLNPLPMMRW